MNPKRQSGPRELQGSDWGDLNVFRSLRKDVFGETRSLSDFGRDNGD